MAPLPKRKISRRRQGKRRAAIKLAIKTVTKCPNCGQLKEPHRVCLSCGQYNNQQVIVKKEKKPKKVESRA